MSEKCVRIWVDAGELMGQVINLVDDLNGLAGAGVDVKEVLMIQADEEWSGIIRKVLSGMNVRVEEQADPLKVVVKINGTGGALKQSFEELNTNMAAPGEKLMDYVSAPVVEVVSLPKCVGCGEHYRPKTKKSVYCEKEECQKERKRVYAREYWRKQREDPVVEEKTEVVIDADGDIPEEKKAAFPYLVVDGKDAGRRLEVETLEVWLKIERLPVGTIVEHIERGRYMVDHKDGKKGLYLRKVVAA